MSKACLSQYEEGTDKQMFNTKILLHRHSLAQAWDSDIASAATVSEQGTLNPISESPLQFLDCVTVFRGFDTKICDIANMNTIEYINSLIK